MNSSVKLGLIGAGSVCELYLPALAQFPDVDVRMIGDPVRDRADERAAAFGIPSSGLPEDVFASPDVEVVLNLTPPVFHAEVAHAALDAGKHVYSEKPLALDSESGRSILDHARSKGLVVGGAPDITLNAGFQRALRMIAQGEIGVPVLARCEAVLAGPEAWHPRPQFLYAAGAGPLFDIGPYYLTALVAALGPITWVSARGTKKAEYRTIGSGPQAGETFPVEVPTLVNAVLGFASGTSAQLLLTFDSASHRGGQMEVLGTDATLRFPDPNGGAADSALLPAGTSDWQALPGLDGRIGFGLGVVNLARHLRTSEPLVVDGVRALHVVELMAAITESMNTATTVSVQTDYQSSPVLPEDWNPLARTL